MKIEYIFAAVLFIFILLFINGVRKINQENKDEP